MHHHSETGAGLISVATYVSFATEMWVDVAHIAVNFMVSVASGALSALLVYWVRRAFEKGKTQ